MTAVFYIFSLLLVSVATGFVCYWSGRSSGESMAYSRARERTDNLREENIRLKLQNERLRGLTGYPEEVSSSVTVIDSPGASASAD